MGLGTGCAAGAGPSVRCTSWSIVLIGISTSGDSANVLAALHMAKEIGVIPAGLSGGSGGAMNGLADPLIIVPSQVTARIQEMHILLGHALCEYLEQRVP